MERGHLFPGVAVADEFRRRDPGTEILFVGTRRGLESRVLGRLGYALRTIPVSGLRGKGAFGILGGLMKIPAALMASRDVLEEFEPHLVFGVGATPPVPWFWRPGLWGSQRPWLNRTLCRA